MEDLFVRPRLQPPSNVTDADASDQANRGAKNLSFSFHVGLYKTGGDSHTVGGHRRRGLIIDPGAANSLVGTETLRDLVDHCDQSSVIKTSMQWQEKQAEVNWHLGPVRSHLGPGHSATPDVRGTEQGDIYRARHRWQLSVSCIGGEPRLGGHESCDSLCLVPEQRRAAHTSQRQGDEHFQSI